MSQARRAVETESPDRHASTLSMNCVDARLWTVERLGSIETEAGQHLFIYRFYFVYDLFSFWIRAIGTMSWTLKRAARKLRA